MALFRNLGEFGGNFVAAFVERRARIKARSLGMMKADQDVAAYQGVKEGLEAMCLPMEDHVTKRGLNQVCSALKNSDTFAASLAIDANPGPGKREVCIAFLKASVVYLCSNDPSDMVRAATYNLIGCK
jgi:hypothetical protein